MTEEALDNVNVKKLLEYVKEELVEANRPFIGQSTEEAEERVREAMTDTLKKMPVEDSKVEVTSLWKSWTWKQRLIWRLIPGFVRRWFVERYHCRQDEILAFVSEAIGDGWDVLEGADSPEGEEREQEVLERASKLFKEREWRWWYQQFPREMIVSSIYITPVVPAEFVVLNLKLDGGNIVGAEEPA